MNNRVVLFAGDSNIGQLQAAATGVLHNEKRVKIYGRSKDKLADTFSFCQNWLQKSDYKALVVVHSGLNDILQVSVENLEEVRQVKTAIIDSVTEFFSQCRNKDAYLKVCSLPEVIDFRRRIDWRAIIFDINVALKKLSLDLGFEFIDLTELASAGSLLMARDGIHYNRRGHQTAMKIVAASVGLWLGAQANARNPSAKFPKTSSSNRRKASASLSMDRYNHVPMKKENKPFTRSSPRRFQRNFSALRRHGGSTSDSYVRPRSAQNVNPLYCRNYMRSPTTFTSHRKNMQVHPEQDHLNPWLPGFVPWSH